MKDLTDFVAVGKDCGLTGDDLFTFAQKEFEKYEKNLLKEEQKEEQRRLKALEDEENSRLKAFEREMRLLERKESISKNEATTAISVNEASSSRNPHVPSFKFTNFNEKVDDLDSWFSLFERQCDIYNVKEKDRKPHLMSLISGQCRQVFLSLDPNTDYKTTKAALLQHFNLTKDEFRKKFFDISPIVDETITSYCQRLKTCFDKWIQLTEITQDYESLRDLIISHRIFDSCNPNLVSFLVERDCYKVKEVEETARRFFQAHNNESLGKPSPFPFSSNYASEQPWRGRSLSRDKDNKFHYKSSFKKEKGNNNFQYKQSDARFQNNDSGQNKELKYVQPVKGNSQDLRKFSTNDKPNVKHSKLQCFLCLGFGHIQRNCSSLPFSAKCTSVKQPNLKDNSVFSISKAVSNDTLIDKAYFSLPDSLCMPANSAREMKDKHIYPGLIECKNSLHAVNVLRDTGSMIHAVHKKFVQPKDYVDKKITLITFGGKTESFNLANITVDTPFLQGKITACVLDDYPPEYMYYDVLIGNGGTLDSPIASDPGFDVVKRWEDSHTDMSANVLESNVLETSDQLKVNQVQTRAQKSNECKNKSSLNDQVLDFNISYDDLAKLQKEDVSLTKYFNLVNAEPKCTKAGSCSFEIRNGVLVRLYKSNRYSYVQVMVPLSLRARIISLGHDMLFSAHMGIHRTLIRVTSSFYWPGIAADIRKFCKSCKICLKTRPKGRTPRAPLQCGTPIIDKPFFKVATDIIGPLPMSENKNQYILTMIDYATRWVEAVPLKNITAPIIAEEFLKIFSRIGIPSVILSDGGPQFVADLMEKVLLLLGIQHSVATPYHPQTNGLCEKINGTIKSLLTKIAHFNHKNWDRLLPCVLFAYRESPQETTGYAPFELVYGSLPRGPMALVKDLWLQPNLELETISTYQYVIDLKQRINEGCKIASLKTEKQKEKSKKLYDRKAKQRTLVPGDKVLLFLPCGENKINSEWKGPFSVVDSCSHSNVNYVIDVNGKHKTYHINMLREFPDRPMHLDPSMSCVNVLHCANIALIDDTYDDINTYESDSLSHIVLPPLKQRESIDDVVVNNDLNNNQKSDINQILHEFHMTFTDVPSQTKCIEHTIELVSHKPVKLKPYPLPFASQQIVSEEVDNMLKAGVISPSTSPYSSPIVLVKKKEGTTRFCIDFRKINGLTVPDATPIPDTELLFTKLSKAKFFTKIDLTKGYWQIPIQQQCRMYTAFQAGSGLYEFNCMPFGLKNAPATFSRMMAKLFGHRTDIVYFFDDVLIYSCSWSEHVKSFGAILGILSQNNLVVRPKKTFCGFSRIDFLGYTIGNGVITPLSDNVTKILNIQQPKTKKQVKSIIGLVNFYAKFIPNISTVLLPLFKLTEKCKPDRIVWTDECCKALTHIQTQLNSQLWLVLPDLSKSFFVQTDASGIGIGGVLLQQHGEHLHPCLYASRKLLPQETRYSVIERECLALIWTLSKFARYLLGNKFILMTDHRPLTHIGKQRSVNSRVCRWSLLLQQFDFSIQFIKGSENFIADYLSRK